MNYKNWREWQRSFLYVPLRFTRLVLGNASCGNGTRLVAPLPRSERSSQGLRSARREPKRNPDQGQDTERTTKGECRFSLENAPQPNPPGFLFLGEITLTGPF